ncbi:MAG TPA: tetratricopeptide repeat protein, partial [Thermoanaerobaculia bacterium]|nr:tetratricopeptide repeat protein [Thermoanaerobaculia bacterium]
LLVALGLLLSVVALALVEGVLRLAGLGRGALYDDPFVGFAPGSDLFEARTLADGTRLWATRPEKLAFFNRQQFPYEKAEGTYRVFTVGGSTAYGSPYDDHVSFSRWLERYLAAADPSRRWEVINAGAQSYASYRVALLMQELVRYEPDLFVVYSGHNEFLEERSYAHLQDGDPLLRRARMALSRFRFAALARRAWQRATDDEGGRAADQPTLAPEVAARLDGWTGLELFERDDDLAEGVVEHYEESLHRMVDVARDHGAEIVFVQTVENLKDFSPFKSQPTGGLAAADRERAAELLARGRRLLDAGDAAGALAALDEASRIDPRNAEIHFRRGRALFALGRRPEAREAFVRAKDEDVAPLRAIEPIHAALARVAAERDVPLVDLQALLAAESRRRWGHEIFGDELFLDHVHPDVPVHDLVARRLLALLVDRGVARPVGAWSDARRQAIYRRVVGALDRGDYARRDLNLAKVLGWAGKLEEAEAPLERAVRVLADDAEVHMNLGIVYHRTGRIDEALAALDRAAELAPGWAMVRFNRGVALAAAGRVDEAIAELETAVRIEPDYAEAQHNLGVLYRRRGELGRAEAALERAGSLRGESPEVLLHLARVHRDAGRFGEAEELLRRLLADDPDDGEARVDLGITLARAGRLEEAAGELARAVEADPESAEGWYNLGVVARQRGDARRAEEAWRRALALAPAHAEALNNLGILAAEQGDLAEAGELLRRAIAAAPDDGDAYFNLGVVESGLGHPEEAGRLIRTALEKEPDDPRFRAALAALERAAGGG